MYRHEKKKLIVKQKFCASNWLITEIKTQICFSGATIFTWTRFNVSFYVHCLSLVCSCSSCRTAADGHCEDTNAGHDTTAMTCFTVLHKTANPVIFYASPTRCSEKSNGSLCYNKICYNKTREMCNATEDPRLYPIIRKIYTSLGKTPSPES